MKKVSFAAKRPTTCNESHRCLGRGPRIPPPPPAPRERMKRLTIDVSRDLHKRIKSQCAIENLVMADEIRDSA